MLVVSRSERIAKNIRNARLQKNLSPETVEKKLGLDPKRLEAIESGHVGLSLEQAGELARLYDVSVESFYFQTDLYEKRKPGRLFGLEWPLSDFAVTILDGLIDLQDKLT